MHTHFADLFKYFIRFFFIGVAVLLLLLWLLPYLKGILPALLGILPGALGLWAFSSRRR